MIEGVIASLAATVIAAITVVLYRRGYLHALFDLMLFHIGPSGARQERLVPKDFTALQSRLVRHLLRDQSRVGLHKGQYGKSCDAVHSGKWQARGSGENLSLKPRMYLTCWPVIVLHNHGLAPRSVVLATSGVRNLFVDGKIPVYRSAPEPSPTGHVPIWNHRHSMAGAHLLAIADPSNATTKRVADQMLDERNAWQHSSGGWWQTSEKKHAPDLWASVYAVKLLDLVDSVKLDVFCDKSDLLRDAIRRTFSYLETEWSQRRWGDPGKLLVEENLVAMFIDLAPILRRYSASLADACIHEMRTWLSPGGALSRSYLSTLNAQSTPIHAQQAYARMAYAFYLAEADACDWRPWFEEAAGSPLDSFFSSELAFLLDMSFRYQEERSRQQTARAYALSRAAQP